MGASSFIEVASTDQYKTAKEAFAALCDRARYEYGHDPYSGTIGTKTSFAMVNCRAGDAIEFVNKQLDGDLDKWGSALCVLDTPNKRWIFFGLAPS